MRTEGEALLCRGQWHLLPPPPTSSWQESVHRVSVGVGVGSNHRVALTASILNQGQ